MSKTEMPSIRFYGFDNDWEQRKLGDIVERVVRKNTNNESSLPLTISAQYGLVDQITYFNNRVASRDVSNYYLVLNGEFAYNKSTSDGFPFGAVKRLDLYEKGVLSTLYIVFSIKNQSEIDSDYLTVFFDTDRWHKGVSERAAEGARNHGLLNISADDFFDIDIFLPRHKEEQVAIGSYLRHLDHLITLHQRKLEKLTNVKKSMLEKMFPRNGSCYPEIRFKGFTDPWEQRKLGEVATFINGRAYSQPELLSSGKYKVLRVGNFYTNDSWYYSDLELGEKYYADYGDLLYTWSATFGPHIWLGDRVIYHYHIWKINLSDQLEKQFAVQLLEQDRANILSSKNGSTMVHITKEGMEQKDVIIPPSTKEQQEIGAFFLQLDNLITLHQRELEKLQNIKKSMLEKMFV